MFALATVETAVFYRAYLLGIPAPEHLVHEAIIVARIVARVDGFNPSQCSAKICLKRFQAGGVAAIIRSHRFGVLGCGE
jgi:hypothetical protein